MRSCDAPVTLRETHISWVFMAGDRAFKLKKPVVLDFVDYGTPARRQAMCQEEVRLNARLAPDLYVGVRSVADRGDRLEIADAGDPAAIDYVVEMRRYDERATLAALAAAGCIAPGQMGAVGERLGTFHAGCPPQRGVLGSRACPPAASLTSPTRWARWPGVRSSTPTRSARRWRACLPTPLDPRRSTRRRPAVAHIVSWAAVPVPASRTATACSWMRRSGIGPTARPSPEGGRTPPRSSSSSAPRRRTYCAAAPQSATLIRARSRMPPSRLWSGSDSALSRLTKSPRAGTCSCVPTASRMRSSLTCSPCSTSGSKASRPDVTSRRLATQRCRAEDHCDDRNRRRLLESSDSGTVPMLYFHHPSSLITIRRPVAGSSRQPGAASRPSRRRSRARGSPRWTGAQLRRRPPES